MAACFGRSGSRWHGHSSARISLSREDVCVQTNEEDTVAYEADSVYGRALIAEISLLAHSQIKLHNNIINVEEICWDVDSGGGEVWPVLVFEEAPYGDLMKQEVKTKWQIHEELNRSSQEYIPNTSLSPQRGYSAVVIQKSHGKIPKTPMKPELWPLRSLRVSVYQEGFGNGPSGT